MCCNLTLKPKSIGKLKTILSYKLIHLTVLYIYMYPKKKNMYCILNCVYDTTIYLG